MKKLSTSIELTNKCNFNCAICPHSKPKLHYRKQGFISQKVFERSVLECNKYAKAVALGFFGEQLLHPDYIELIKTLKKRSFKLIVNTNISVCTKEIMKAWIEAHVDEVRFSLDAIRSNTFNICRPGTVKDFNGKIVSKKDRLATLNEKVNYWLTIPKHCPTRLVYVKSSFNKKDNKAFVRYWQSRIKKQDHILLKQVLSYGGKIKNSYVLENQCNIWNVGYLMIGWNGVVSPCNLDINLELKLGNILNTSIPNLYHGVRAKKLRSLTGCGNNIIPCKTCIDSNNWNKNQFFRATK